MAADASQVGDGAAGADGPVPPRWGSKWRRQGDSAAAAPPDPEGRSPAGARNWASKTAELRASRASRRCCSRSSTARRWPPSSPLDRHPVGRMVTDEINTACRGSGGWASGSSARDHGLNVIAEAMRTSRAKLTRPAGKPIGVFPAGRHQRASARRRPALTLAELLYGGQQNLTTINMSEFKEEHKVSLLMGSAAPAMSPTARRRATEAVRGDPTASCCWTRWRRPTPASRTVLSGVRQGMLRERRGALTSTSRTPSSSLTSKRRYDTIAALAADPETMPDANGLLEALRPELLKVLQAGIPGPGTVVPYFPLQRGDGLRPLARLQLRGACRQRVRATAMGALRLRRGRPSMPIASRATESESGARNIESTSTAAYSPSFRPASGADGGGRGGTSADRPPRRERRVAST